MSQDSSASGIGFAPALGLLFIGLKLGHVIEWPWLWVLAPIWIPLAILFVILALACLTYRGH